MAVEKIQYTDTLRQGADKINAAIDQSNEAIEKATTADANASQALALAQNVQTQLDQIVIEGDSSVEAAQARVDAEGRVFTTLKERLDTKETNFDNRINSLETITNEHEIELNERIINIKQFGAVGDGMTDDTVALQNAIASLGADGGMLLLPRGRYLFNQTIVLGRGQTLMGSGHEGATTLVYQGSGSAIDVDTGGALKNVRVEKYHASGWDGWDTTNPVSGVRMIGSWGRVEDIWIEGFEIGLFLYGNNVGCAYNQAFLRFIRNCLIGIKLDAEGTGWVNENSVYGGGITIESNKQGGPTWQADSWGIYINSSANSPNNNKFFGVSIEGMNHGIRITGFYNSFYGPRIEIPGQLKVLFEDTDAFQARYNWIFGMYGNFAFGTNVVVRDANGLDRTNMFDNMIVCRSLTIPLSLTQNTIEFLPGFREARIKYNQNVSTFEFWHLGSKIAELDMNGNLKLKGVVSENQTFN